MSRQQAHEFVVFCDGVEAAGLTDYARRGRALAALYAECLAELEAERSARVALQQRIERMEEIILSATGADSIEPPL